MIAQLADGIERAAVEGRTREPLTSAELVLVVAACVAAAVAVLIVVVIAINYWSVEEEDAPVAAFAVGRPATNKQ